MSNKCGMGYCARSYTDAEVQVCQNKLGEKWNGLCAYQNGQYVKDDEEFITLDCCDMGCKMPRGQYARWNGLCAYMGKREDATPAAS